MTNSLTNDSIETDELIQIDMTINEPPSNERHEPFKRRPPTFEAAFSQARSLPNHARVNYQQALINNNHSTRIDSLVLLPPPSSSQNNNHQSLERFILNEQSDLPVHDPINHFLTNQLADSQSSSSSTEPFFNPSISSPPTHYPQPQHSISVSPPPPPPTPQPLISLPHSPTPFLEDPNSSPPGLYGSSPPPADHEPESPRPSPPAAPKVISPPKKSLRPSHPPPPKLCLPRPRRPVIETSQTPYNSPASTPTIATSNLRPVTEQPPNILKRYNQPSSSSSTTDQPTAAKKQKINPLFLNSSSHSSIPKVVSENDKLQVWKRIHLLRAQRELHHQRTLDSSSKTSEELDRLEKLAYTNPLSSAIELKNQAQEYVDLIQKVQHALGEELVRVQLEESVLRHVRGIIADRLVKNQEWNHQHS